MDTIFTAPEHETQWRTPLCQAFDTLDQSQVLFAMPFNLTSAGEIKSTEGVIGATKEDIYILNIDTGEKKTLPFDTLKKFAINVGTGSVGIEYTDSGGVHALCTADMSMKIMYAYAVKLFNRRLKYGTLRPDGVNRRTTCTKCHRPYAPGATYCFACADKKKHFGWLWSFLRPYQIYIYLATVLFIVVTFLSILLPRLNANLIDNFIRAEDPPMFAQFLVAILSIVGVNLLVRAFRFLRRRAMLAAQIPLSTGLRETMFDKIQRLTMRNVARRTAGSLIQRVNNDTRQVVDFLTNEFPNLIDQVLIFIVVTGILVTYDPMLAVMIITPMPFILIAFRMFSRKVRRIFGFQRHVSDVSNTIMQDIFSGIRVVKAFGMEESEIEKYDRAAYDEFKIQKRAERFFGKLFPVLIFFMGVGEFFLLYYVGNRILAGEMTMGEMTMFGSYVAMLYGPLRWLAWMPQRMIRTMTSLVRIHDVVSDPETMDDGQDSVELEIQGHIKFENVSFSYEDAVEVLNDVSFEIKPGEMVGIVGRSGAGKSTLINLVMRMYDVGEGRITIDDVDIRDISQNVLRSQVGAVLQETFLFAGSIYDNIAYANPGATREEVINAAKTSTAHEFIVRLPDGYNTYVGERGHSVSGGERQRIAIARALLHNPRILILDEATASLDTETEKQIQDAIARLISNRTTFAIAHRLSTLRNATRIIVVDDHTIAEVGTHDELMERGGIYHGLIMAQRQMSQMPEGDGSVLESVIDNK